MTGVWDILGPDLVFGGFALDADGLQDGRLIRFSGTMLNVGTDAASASSVALYLTADEEIGADDLVLSIMDLAGVSPGHLIDFSGMFTLPDLPASSEQVYIGAVVDFANDVEEAEEGNNAALIPLALTSDVSEPGPTTNIEPFVLVLRKDVDHSGAQDMPTNARIAEALPNAQYLEAVRDLTAAGLEGFSTVSLSEEAALVALAGGELDAAFLARDSILLHPLADDFAAFEIPNSPGNLMAFDADIRLISGTSGADTLLSTAGNDVIVGNDGYDSAGYSGTWNSYTLTLTPSSMTLLDRRPDGDGIDSLFSIERLEFGTGGAGQGTTALDIVLFTGPTSLDQGEFESITELYIAYFNRAPDALGLFYWGTEFAKGFSLEQIATSFFAQPETQTTYAHVLGAQGQLLNTEGFVDAVYRNVLGRDPDPDGFAYWVDQLDTNPFITPPIFILSVIGGAKFPSSPTPQTRIDQEYLANKVDIGAYFAAIKGLSDTQDAKEVMALFDGSSETVQTARDAIDAHYSEALDPEEGAFIFQLVGVLDDPFAIV